MLHVEAGWLIYGPCLWWMSSPCWGWVPSGCLGRMSIRLRSLVGCASTSSRAIHQSEARRGEEEKKTVAFLAIAAILPLSEG